MSEGVKGKYDNNGRAKPAPEFLRAGEAHPRIFAGEARTTIAN